MKDDYPPIVIDTAALAYRLGIVWSEEHECWMWIVGRDTTTGELVCRVIDDGIIDVVCDDSVEAAGG